jgi:hypothetical protein
MDSFGPANKNRFRIKKMTFINGKLNFFNEIYAIINYNILRPWR